MSIRRFSIVILNEYDVIIDRYNLDCITAITGLGYNLKVSVISGEVEDYVTKIVQQKKTIGFKVHFQGYSEADVFDSFIEKNINNVICLEYDNTKNVRYIAVKPIETSKTELTEYKILEDDLKFQPLTPFFEKIDNDVKITISSVGKSYNFAYPYAYGLNAIENNEIKNTYIKDIPIIVTINGSISNPIVVLRDENNDVYNEVRFLNVDLLAGQKIIINSAQKKIWFDDGTGALVDYYFKIDGAYDSYLFAKPLTTSHIGINLVSTDTGSLTGSRRQYKL